MSKLQKFLGKPITIQIEGEDIEIKPLTVKDLDIVVNLQNKEKQAECMQKMILRTLKRSFPDEKMEDLEQFALEHFQVLVDAILEVNGLEDTKKKVEKHLSLSETQKEE
jgi:hypothetical protein